MKKKIICSVMLVGVFAGFSIQAEEPAEAVVRLEQELKASKTKINELEEQLFVATDGKGVAGEEVVEELPEGTYAWTENMRRSPVGILFPTTATISKGDVYARFSHVSQNQGFAGDHDPLHDMLGQESGVKVGIMFGYGILDNWDVTVQRTNGRDYTYEDVNYESHSYDLYDVMTKVKLLDESKQFIDLAAIGGTTCFWQDNGRAEYAANAAILAEKSFWRFRAGSGILYTSLSDYGTTFSAQDWKANDKLYVNEITSGESRPTEHTVAIPVSLSFALTRSIAWFGEAAFPVDGYDTDLGPSVASGVRIATHSHTYSLFLSNTSNNGYNSTFVGGYKHDRLDVFGFDIAIFF